MDIKNTRLTHNKEKSRIKTKQDKQNTNSKVNNLNLITLSVNIPIKRQRLSGQKCKTQSFAT